MILARQGWEGSGSVYFGNAEVR
ncbi:hypothetical protein BCEN4_140095 [Burkholderia cenocepacia]|nr:hypothetical protein BCEN4_140095 [Burkholderia cenocepacia]CAG9263817.1 hypothetical protein BCEP4_3040002 [Burkholderia cepacia]